MRGTEPVGPSSRDATSPQRTTHQEYDFMSKYVCPVCGYVYEGDELPEDFVCPLCKHGASDFEPIE
jgi:rubredoxin